MQDGLARKALTLPCLSPLRSLSSISPTLFNYLFNLHSFTKGTESALSTIFSLVARISPLCCTAPLTPPIGAYPLMTIVPSSLSSAPLSPPRTSLDASALDLLFHRKMWSDQLNVRLPLIHDDSPASKPTSQPS